MTRPRIILAAGDYDITRPLLDGSVRVQGADVVPLSYPSPQRHWRMLKHAEFDVAEMSLGSYVAHRSAGGQDLIAIPVFPHRRFRHGYVFTSTVADIRVAKDLAGKQIGVRSWQTTAGVWVRGILAEHHDLPLSSVRWRAQDGEDIELTLPEGVELSQVEQGHSVVEMCERGELAGLVYPEIPDPVRAGKPTISRLFDDSKAAEQSYFTQTGIFPIMHVVVLRSEVAEAYPWLPRNLADAFQEAKTAGMQRLQNPRTVSLAWLRTLQDEERALLGPDPWHYGLDSANLHVLRTFLRYSVEQGVARRSIEPAELFASSTVEDPPAYV